MKTFILIHGMWHGGWCWERLTPLLRAAGHVVYVPTLAGLAERAHLRNDNIDLNTHIQEIINLCEANDLHEMILVGHSLGGIMAPVVADRIPERIAHIVNLDGIALAAYAGWRACEPDTPDARARLAGAWFGLLALGTLRSPFAPPEAYIPLVWALALRAAAGQRRRDITVAVLLWLTTCVVIPVLSQAAAIAGLTLQGIAFTAAIGLVLTSTRRPA